MNTDSGIKKISCQIRQEIISEIKSRNILTCSLPVLWLVPATEPGLLQRNDFLLVEDFVEFFNLCRSKTFKCCNTCGIKTSSSFGPTPSSFLRSSFSSAFLASAIAASTFFSSVFAAFSFVSAAGLVSAFGFSAFGASFLTGASATAVSTSTNGSTETNDRFFFFF